jgi:hypothetical protein
MPDSLLLARKIKKTVDTALLEMKTAGDPGRKSAICETIIALQDACPHIIFERFGGSSRWFRCRYCSRLFRNDEYPLKK